MLYTALQRLSEKHPDFEIQAVNTIFVCPYPMCEEQKKVIQKEMDRLEHLGII